MNLRQLTYNPIVGEIVRKLHVRAMARVAYYYLNYPRKGRLPLSCMDVSVRFCARDPIELRIVELAWLSEQDFIPVLLEHLEPGDTFLDVGSNLGMFSIFAARKVGPEGLVVAFDPEEGAFQRLQENIALNDLTNVRSFQIALSDRDGRLALQVGSNEDVSQGSRLVPIGNDNSAAQRTVSVMIGDHFIQSERLRIPKVVKIDVEGHEHATLMGLRETLSSPLCKMLLCELHPRQLPSGISTDDVLRVIESCGFARRQMHEINTQIHLIASK